MNKQDIAKYLAQHSEVTAAQASKVLDSLSKLALERINAGEKLILPGFGIFAPKHTEARMGRNPQKNEQQQFPAKNSIKFRPSTDFQRGITQPAE